MLAKSLDTPVKTVLSRLSRARKFGILTPSPKVSAGRASGKMTEQGKKLINEITEEIFI
jgi:hypothetical protein